MKRAQPITRALVKLRKAQDRAAADPQDRELRAELRAAERDYKAAEQAAAKATKRDHKAAVKTAAVE